MTLSRAKRKTGSKHNKLLKHLLGSSLLQSRSLHVVLVGGGGAVAVVLGGSPRAAGSGPAEAAQQTTGQEQQHAGGPAQVDAGAHLPLHGGGDQRVVEVPDGDVGGPADGDDDQQAGQQQPHAAHQVDLGFGVLVLDAGGEVGAAEHDEEAEGGQHAADDGHGAGGLQVGGQHQDGVVVLALLLARALHHALHPQTLLGVLGHKDAIGQSTKPPEPSNSSENICHHLSRHNVGANEGRHSPARKSAGHHHADQSQDPEGHARHLDGRGSHLTRAEEEKRIHQIQQLIFVSVVLVAAHLQ